jgi:5-(carboxyamino)imidazole ribonucleotide synthase
MSLGRGRGEKSPPAHLNLHLKQFHQAKVIKNLDEDLNNNQIYNFMRKTRVGIVGGGQLARMMGEAISEKDLPYTLAAIDPTPNCPASPFLDHQIVAGFKDVDKIIELAGWSDVVTFEIESAGAEILGALEKEGKSVHPSPATLQIIQDKLRQAKFLEEQGIPVPESRAIRTMGNITQAIEKHGFPLMIKARKDSYDGKGNFILRGDSQVEKAMNLSRRNPRMFQEFIDFDHEISVIAARSVDGNVATYPIGKNIHGTNYNILLSTVVPARVNDKVLYKAEEVAKKTMGALKGAGVFGIEMLVKDDDIWVNEIAPRVHNSGHWTIEGCETSQFEQHLRAITGQPLGEIGPTRTAVMCNIIGAGDYSGSSAITYNRRPIIGVSEVEQGVFVHDYGKHETRPQRKMGHFTALGLEGEDQDNLIHRALSIQKLIKIKPRK